jgi:uncharacterized protein (TIGR02466 family)
MFNTHHLFPTTIISSNIGRTITKEELEIVETYRKDLHKNVGNSNSKHSYVLNKDFPEIKKFILYGIKTYVDSVFCPKYDIEFYITQSWLNWTNPKEFHHKHEHPNSIISGVFYFNAIEGKDRITFFKESYDRIRIEPKEWNYQNSKSWWLPIKTGDLMLFSSDTTHMVDLTESDETRISLAFNVFAKGYLGNEDSLTALHL